METASRDREPIIITRNGAGKVLLLAIEEYDAMETTLLSTLRERTPRKSSKVWPITQLVRSKRASYTTDMVVQRLERLPLLAGARAQNSPACQRTHPRCVSEPVYRHRQA